MCPAALSLYATFPLSKAARRDQNAFVSLLMHHKIMIERHHHGSVQLLFDQSDPSFALPARRRTRNAASRKETYCIRGRDDSIVAAAGPGQKCAPCTLGPRPSWLRERDPRLHSHFINFTGRRAAPP